MCKTAGRAVSYKSLLASAVLELQSGAPTLALWTLTVMDVGTVRTVHVVAERAVQHIDALKVISTRQTCIPDDDLRVHTDKSGLGRGSHSGSGAG